MTLSHQLINALSNSGVQNTFLNSSVHNALSNSAVQNLLKNKAINNIWPRIKILLHFPNSQKWFNAYDHQNCTDRTFQTFWELT